MRTLAFAILPLVACSSSREAKPPAGALASLPTADWPCARRETVTIDGPNGPSTDTTLTALRYGVRDTCVIPFDLVTEGITGCVATIVAHDQPLTATYDGPRLVGLGMYTADWKGDVVHEVNNTATLHGKRIETHRADGSPHTRLDLDDAGRPRHEEVVPHDPTEKPMMIDYHWGDRRLATIDLVNGNVKTHYEMVYACDKP